MKAEDLRKSILQLAIQGKLVKQNPDDEPASALIERIRSEKQRLVKEGKIKKDKAESFIFKGTDNSYYEKIGTETRCIDEEIPFEVPESWKWCRLGTIIQSTSGGTPERTNPDYWKGNINWLKSGELNDGYIEVPSEEKITSEGLNNSSAKLFPKGTLLIALYGATAGKLGILNYESSTNQAICGFFENKNVETKYLFHFFMSLREKMIADSWGQAQPNISQSYLKQLCFPLPPLAEQQRIVNQLETLVPLITEYDKYEKQEAQLTADFPNTLKKTILQSAIQGKLVAQNPDDEPASVLLDKIRKEKEQLIKLGKLKRGKTESFIYKDTTDNSYYEKIGSETRCIDEEIPFEIPESWTLVRLGSICNTIHYGFTASASQTGNSKLLRITDIQDNKVNWQSVPFCTVTENESATYQLNNKDILIARTGGTIGKTYIVDNLAERVVFASYLIRAIPNENIYPQYLKSYMESPFYWQQLTKKSMGTGQPNVNGESLKSLLVPLPSLREQRAIVKAIDNIFVIINRIRRKSY